MMRETVCCSPSYSVQCRQRHLRAFQHRTLASIKTTKQSVICSWARTQTGSLLLYATECTYELLRISFAYKIIIILFIAFCILLWVFCSFALRFMIVCALNIRTHIQTHTHAHTLAIIIYGLQTYMLFNIFVWFFHIYIHDPLNCICTCLLYAMLCLLGTCHRPFSFPIFICLCAYALGIMRIVDAAVLACT